MLLPSATLPSGTSAFASGKYAAAQPPRKVVGDDLGSPRPSASRPPKWLVRSTRSPAAQPCGRDVVRVKQHDAAVAGDAAIAIVRAVDRRVELVVAADRRQSEAAPARARAVGSGNVRERARCRGRVEVPRAAPRSAARKPPGCAHAAVEVLEAGHDPRDARRGCGRSPRPARPRSPARRRRAATRARPATIAGSLRSSGEAGFSASLRAVHHAHRILDRHELRPPRLHVALAAAEARQHDRLFGPSSAACGSAWSRPATVSRQRRERRCRVRGVGGRHQRSCRPSR